VKGRTELINDNNQNWPMHTGTAVSEGKRQAPEIMEAMRASAHSTNLILNKGTCTRQA